MQYADVIETRHRSASPRAFPVAFQLQNHFPRLDFPLVFLFCEHGSSRTSDPSVAF